MPKSPTKQHIVNVLNELFYDINFGLMCHSIVKSGDMDWFIDDAKEKGACEEHAKELVEKFVDEELIPISDEIQKLYFIRYTYETLSNEAKEMSEEIEQLKKEHMEAIENTSNIIKLIHGCDTLEKLNMLKELPIFEQFIENRSSE